MMIKNKIKRVTALLLALVVTVATFTPSLSLIPAFAEESTVVSGSGTASEGGTIGTGSEGGTIGTDSEGGTIETGGTDILVENGVEAYGNNQSLNFVLQKKSTEDNNFFVRVHLDNVSYFETEAFPNGLNFTATDYIEFADIIVYIHGTCTIGMTNGYPINYNSTMIGAVNYVIFLEKDAKLNLSRTCVDDNTSIMDNCGWLCFENARDSKGSTQNDDIINDLRYLGVSSNYLEYNDTHTHEIVYTYATDPTCTEPGYRGHYTCTVCDRCFEDSYGENEITLDSLISYPANGHNLEEQEAREATCFSSGCIAHKACTECGALFVENQGELVEVTSNDVLIYSQGHNYTFVPGVEATCTSDGSIDHYFCELCLNAFLDTGDKEYMVVNKEDYILPAVPHEFESVDEVYPTCRSEGRLDHCVCSKCHQLFRFDWDKGEYVVYSEDELVVPALDHNLNYIDGVEPSCSRSGIRSYYECWSCQGVFLEVDGEYVEVDRSQLELEPTSHNYSELEGSEATCERAGSKDCYYCLTCGSYFLLVDNEYQMVTPDDIVIPATGHNYEEHPAVNPTCTEAGNMLYFYCADCDQYFTEKGGNAITLKEVTIPASGHSTEYVAEQAATCDSAGYQEHYRCTACGTLTNAFGTELQLEEIELKPLGHNYMEHEANIASCSQEGNKAYFSCSRCDKLFLEMNGSEVPYESIVLPKTDHTLTSFEAEPATCINYGVIAYFQCSDCLECFALENGNYVTINKEDTIIEALGHDYTFVPEVLPTCDSQGNIEYYQCTRCQRMSASTSLDAPEITMSDVIRPALEHVLGYHDPIAPSCEGEGRTGYYQCDNCNRIFLSKDGDAVEEKETIVSPTGHEYAVHSAVESTCVKAGNVLYYSCNICGKLFLTQGGPEVSIKETEASLREHTYAIHASTPATCEESGTKTYYSCSVCDQIFLVQGGEAVTLADTVVDPTGHTYVSHEAKAPTCLEEGNKEYYTCSVCDKIFLTKDGEEVSLKETIVALAEHTYETHEAKAATCVNEGNKEYYTCSVCDKIFLTQGGDAVSLEETVVALAEHTYETHEAKTATCVNEGNKEYYTCTVCNKIFLTKGGEEVTLKETVVALAEHTYETHKAKAATCLEKGNKEYYTCSVCNKIFLTKGGDEVSLSDTWIEATGHNMENVPSVAPTCTEAGRKEYFHCQVCEKDFVLVNEQYAEATESALQIPRLGHNFANAETKYPTCVEKGYQKGICLNCGEEAIEEIETLAPHTLTKHVEVPSTCVKQGHGEYFTCSVCQGMFVMENADYVETNEEDILLPINPQNHTGEVVVRNRDNPMINHPGYSGDIYCASCNVLLQIGENIPALNYSESMSEEEKQEAKNTVGQNLDYLISGQGEAPTEEKVQQAIEAIDLETAVTISELVSGSAKEMQEIFKDVPKDEKVEVQPGVELTQEEVMQVISAVTEATVLVAGNQEKKMEAIEKVADSIPEDSGVDLQGAVSSFYQNVLDELMGKKNSKAENQNIRNSKNNGAIVLLGSHVFGNSFRWIDDESEEGTGIDYSVSAETYKKAFEFVDVSVGNMQTIAQKIRECSGEKMKESINRYISGVSSQSFRDFDRAKADEEFLEAAYEAILISLQETVKAGLVKSYEAAKAKATGKELAELNATFEEEMEKVSHLHFLEDIPMEECDGCFEDVVVEVMRLKFISILDEKYGEGSITESVYIENLEKAHNVDTFAPVYRGIFRCWALGEEDTSDVQISLETLSNAAVETSTRKMVAEKVIAPSLTPLEITFFAVIVGAGFMLIIAYVYISTVSKKKGVA